MLPPNEDQILLAELLAGKQRIEKVMREFAPDDFDEIRNKRIFQAMLFLYMKDLPIDRVSVAEQLLRLGWLEKCGGIAYLVQLDDYLDFGKLPPIL